MTIASIVLAAGHGKRMHSSLPKVLHPLLGNPMLLYSIETAQAVADLPPVVVIGHDADKVQEAISRYATNEVRYAVQSDQLGTGHAVQCAREALVGKSDKVLVTFGDMPMLTSQTLKHLVELQEAQEAVLCMTSVVGNVPRGFGRVLRGEDGAVCGIVEEAVATPEQLAIREYNISAYCFDADWLWENLDRIQVSPKGEYYLTDLVELAVKSGRKVASHIVEDPVEGYGVNTRVDLADCETGLRARINREWMLAGVTLLDPVTTTIEPDVRIGQDTVIYPSTHLRGQTVIGENCVIGPETTLIDTQVGDLSEITYAVAEKAVIGNHVTMGPYAHLRKGAVLRDHVHMGNFGEVKDSELAEGVKMGHFSYIGNAKIGARVNIGAGTITCNFDGVNKNPTEIGEDTFIGSDTMLVAPLKIGKNSKTGAGAVVTHDVPDNTVVIGVPARELKRKESSD